MSSTKYVAHRATIKILKSLLGNAPKKYDELMDGIDVNNGYQLMNYLRKGDYVEKFENKDNVYYRLTQKGENRLIKVDIETMSLKHKKEWDGKWRIVCFDIPEKYKNNRRLISKKLAELGFKQVQKSVYIYPHECLEEIETLRCHYEVRDYVFLFTSSGSEIENNVKLKKIFKI